MNQHFYGVREIIGQYEPTFRNHNPTQLDYIIE